MSTHKELKEFLPKVKLPNFLINGNTGGLVFDFATVNDSIDSVIDELLNYDDGEYYSYMCNTVTDKVNDGLSQAVLQSIISKNVNYKSLVKQLRKYKIDLTEIPNNTKELVEGVISDCGFGGYIFVHNICVTKGVESLDVKLVKSSVLKFNRTHSVILRDLRIKWLKKLKKKLEVQV